MVERNPSVDGYIRKNKAWQRELEALRAIALDCGLAEEIKWRTPCYTYQGANLVMVSGWKEHAIISFLKGVLLKDEKGILEAPGRNSRVARMVKFKDARQVQEHASLLKAYILEAIELEKAGAKVDLAKDRELPIPQELQASFDADAAFKEAFFALTPGRRRGWIIHITGAKQSKTRTSRIGKAMPRIFKGQGWNDMPR